MLDSKLYTEVRNWIYRNARPLDLARWQYHFEEGSALEVIKALAAYQNEDGGFGYALEADSWNPNSTPIQTFHAVTILREIDFTDRKHPMIERILMYLDSGKDFIDNTWQNMVLTSNDYPHASWWHYNSESWSHNTYNPTIGLVGFALYYAERDSKLFAKCAAIAKDAVSYLLQTDEVDMHTLFCFITMAEYVEKAGITDLFSLAELESKLKVLVSKSITKDTSIWATSYVCKPSQFFRESDSIYYQDNADIADYECKFIKNTRNSEGVWDITWGWEAYPEEWAISKNWWKGTVAIHNVLYLKYLDK